MPANEIVWRAKVWEHTRRLAERSFPLWTPLFG